MRIFKHQSGKSVTIDGASIYYEEAGLKSGEPVLMLHGGFGTLEDFGSIVKTFLPEHRVIVMDGRGQGKSTLDHNPLTYQAIRKDAESLLTHLGISRCVVIGFSDGGMVGHLMAMSENSMVSKLISIAAPWRKEDLNMIRESLQKVTVQSWREKFPESYNLYESLNTQVDFNELVDQLKHMWLDESASGGYPEDDVSKIACPTLIIRGDDDQFFSRESAVALANKIGNAKLLNIPFGGHEIHKDQPHIVSQIALNFIKS